MALLNEIAAGRTDGVFEFLAAGGSASAATEDGVPLVAHCAYYGDVSALKFLLANGASLRPLGENLGLSAASFHGHWRLCRFLIEQGADVNHPDAGNGETPLHAALSTPPGSQPGIAGPARRWRQSQLRNAGGYRNRLVHARLPHQRRNAATPRCGFR